MQINRLTGEGRIDKDKPVNFRFNDKSYTGFVGDTLASALLSNGIRMIGRSFKYHRPRGIVGSGVEDPNSLVQIDSGNRTLPNHMATQTEIYEGLDAKSINVWPSLDFDLLSINDLISPFLPPGFYYKTFMWPQWMWPFYERQLRNAGGFGVAPAGPDPDRYEKTNAHCDVLVVGGGPSGLAAALESGRTGARVILVDEQNELGGTLLTNIDQIDGDSASDWIRAVEDELNRMPNVQILSRTTAFGYYDHNFVTAIERVTDHESDNYLYRPRQRLWRIRAGSVVLATGALERPLIFPNNDRPGIMLASAVLTYVKRYQVLPGRCPVFFTNNDTAYRLTLELAECGVSIQAVVDLRSAPEGHLIDAVRDKGIPVLTGSTITHVKGTKSVRSVGIMRHNGIKSFGGTRWIDCDLIAMSGGWSPVVNLHSQAGGKPNYDLDRVCFVPDEAFQTQKSVGSCNGTFNLQDCLNEGSYAGANMALEMGFGNGKVSGKFVSKYKYDSEPKVKSFWALYVNNSILNLGKSFVDFQTDTTAKDIVIAAKEGYESIEHVKRYTTLGMGTDQGKLGNFNGIGILAELLSRSISDVGTTTFRQPYSPVTYGAIAGREVGNLFDPIRKSPMHDLHVASGADFEDVGQWKRPWYYPRVGESMQDAVNRECLAVRENVGLLDASTLGKIDIKGPDSASFLNRIYTNGWTRLDIGRCRYGFMLGEDGMILDDGVTARIAEDHFLMHTTTSGAPAVMSWLERWLQTEWPDLQVYLTSVTEHWATLSLNGPYSRRVMDKVCDGIDLSMDKFPFMSVKTGTVAGVPARIFRISFAGELSFEINVNANYGFQVWESVMEAGEEFGIMPYGTEAMHVLRAEKGYVIVGQDTDGSNTPVDIGASKMLSTRKDFLGKRSLSRPEMVQKDRKQLIGLLSKNREDMLAEGGQIIQDLSDVFPIPMLGHVTSSYFSNKLECPIALALIHAGRARLGDEVLVYMADRSPIKAIIVDPVFFDPNGERQNVE